MMALAPYSARVQSTRSPARSGKAWTAAFQAVVCESTRAISSGAGPEQPADRGVRALEPVAAAAAAAS